MARECVGVKNLIFLFFAFSYANKFEVSFMKNYNYFFERCPCYRNRTFWEIDFFHFKHWFYVKYYN